MSNAQRDSLLRVLAASDIWSALGLPEHAAAEAVRQAFRRESRLLHPDKNPLPEAEAAFKKLRALLPDGPPPSTASTSTAAAATSSSAAAPSPAKRPEPQSKQRWRADLYI